MERLFKFEPEVLLSLTPAGPLEVCSASQQVREVGVELLADLVLDHEQDGVSAHVREAVLGHVGLEVAPMALDIAVTKDDEELLAPVDALDNILRHSDSYLHNIRENQWEISIRSSPTLKSLSWMQTFSFGLFSSSWGMSCLVTHSWSSWL